MKGINLTSKTKFLYTNTYLCFISTVSFIIAAIILGMKGYEGPAIFTGTIAFFLGAIWIALVVAVFNIPEPKDGKYNGSL